MFEKPDEVIEFVDHLEKFILAVINNLMSNNVEDAVALNRKRVELEACITKLSGARLDIPKPDILECPDCGSEMRLRTNRQDGNKFWGCTKYPNCRGTRDEDGLSKEQREEEKHNKELIDKEGGFSFNRDKRNPVTEVSPPVDTGWVNPFAKK